MHFIGVPDKTILTISKEKKMSTFEEAVDIVSNKMNKTLSNDELKEVNIHTNKVTNEWYIIMGKKVQVRSSMYMNCYVLLCISRDLKSILLYTTL